MNNDKNDNELMMDFANCSMKSFTIIFERYKNRILNFVLRGYLHEKQEAEDIVQKALIKVYQYKYKYKPSNQFSTWAYTIAKNLALNEIKRKKKLKINNVDNDCIDALEDSQSFQRQFEEVDINKLMLKTIEALKPKYREIITMRYLEKLSYKEISKITFIRINTLKSQSKRALEQLQDKLKIYGIEQ